MFTMLGTAIALLHAEKHYSPACFHATCISQISDQCLVLKLAHQARLGPGRMLLRSSPVRPRHKLQMRSRAVRAAQEDLVDSSSSEARVQAERSNPRWDMPDDGMTCMCMMANACARRRRPEELRHLPLRHLQHLTRECQ